MSAARSSNRKPSEIANEPKRSHSIDSVKRAPPNARTREPAATRTAARSETTTEAAGLRARRRAISPADASGARRTRSARDWGVIAGSVPEGVQLVHLDRLARPEEGDDDREAHGDLGRRDREGEEHEDVA